MSLIGPLAVTLPVPRDDSGKPLIATLEALAENAIASGATALSVFGNAADAPYFPRSVRRRAIRAIKDIADKKVPILVGTSALSGAEAIANITEAADLGADAVLVQPLALYPLSASEAEQFYRDVTDRAQCAVWIDNTPNLGAYRLTLNEVLNIALIPRITGIKDAAGSSSDARERLTKVAQHLPRKISVRREYGFVGTTYGAQALIDGAATWHTALGGVLPEYFGAISYLVAQGRHREAQAFQHNLTSVAILEERYGSLRVAHAIGLIRGYEMGTLTKPVAPLSRTAMQLLRLSVGRLDVPEELRGETRAAVSARFAHRMPDKSLNGKDRPIQGRHSN